MAVPVACFRGVRDLESALVVLTRHATPHALRLSARQLDTAVVPQVRQLDG